MVAPESDKKIYDDMHVFYEDEEYFVRYELVEGCKFGVIAFAGIGLELGGIQLEEFRNTLKGRANAVYIADTKRSWWNNGRVEDLIADSIALMRRHGIETIHALGNSMGACGGILAAHLFPEISRTFAFVPQAIPYADRRWKHYTDTIETVRWPNFAALRAKGELVLIFGDRGPDIVHLTEFQASGHTVRVFENVGHEIGRELKERGKYEAVLKDFW